MIRTRALIVGTAVAVGGCSATYSVRPPAGADAREIIVRFTTPRELEALTPAGVRQRLADVQALRGNAVGVRNDTLEFRIARLLETPRLQQPTTWRRLSPPLILTLSLQDGSLRFESQRRSPGRTMALFALGIPAALFLFGSIHGADR